LVLNSRKERYLVLALFLTPEIAAFAHAKDLVEEVLLFCEAVFDRGGCEG
jgi:hypothetical protein